MVHLVRKLLPEAYTGKHEGLTARSKMEKWGPELQVDISDFAIGFALAT
jgi:hypothetical protein